jgi:hypothetical protein
MARRSTEYAKQGVNGVKDASFCPSLDPTRVAQVKAIHDSAPKHMRARYLEAVMGSRSRKRAMQTMCLMCCGWERNEVCLCTARGCPLWAYRATNRSVRA